MRGYKLFEMDRKGNLHPLFIGTKQITPVGEWIKGEVIPTKGYAVRPGWHIGMIPDAPWLKGYDGSDRGLYKSKRKNGKRVWCEVEWNKDHNYTKEVRLLPKKCFTDHVPEGGYYFFKEAGDRPWVITSDIKVIKIISEEERVDILQKMGYNEVEAYRKYKLGFEKRLKKVS